MPKKGAGGGGGKKATPPSKKKTAGAEAMPQVWLPDQPQPALNNDSFPELPHNDTNEQGPPPTDEEQQQMALLWAKEEEQAPKGWDEEEELDYTEVVRKREEREREREASMEAPDLFKYAQSSTFPVRALGTVHSTPYNDSHTNTLDAIDKAQKQGLLPWVTTDKDQRILSVSKYGVKVTDTQRQRVFHRVPLHRIVNITYYDDTYRRPMLAVRVAREGDGQEELFVYESADEAQAKDICLTLAQAFEAVHNRLQLEQNLTSHTPKLR